MVRVFDWDGKTIRNFAPACAIARAWLHSRGPTPYDVPEMSATTLDGKPTDTQGYISPAFQVGAGSTEEELFRELLSNQDGEMQLQARDIGRLDCTEPLLSSHDSGGRP